MSRDDPFQVRYWETPDAKAVSATGSERKLPKSGEAIRLGAYAGNDQSNGFVPASPTV